MFFIAPILTRNAFYCALCSPARILLFTSALCSRLASFQEARHSEGAVELCSLKIYSDEESPLRDGFFMCFIIGIPLSLKNSSLGKTYSMTIRETTVKNNPLELKNPSTNQFNQYNDRYDCIRCINWLGTWIAR